MGDGMSEDSLSFEQREELNKPRTLSRRDMAREARRREKAGEKLEILEYDRPMHRSHCREGSRPCLFVACKYHLYLDVNPETGSVKLNFPDKEVWELEETCSLDVAEKGGLTLEEVGGILNLTRERVRQVEVSGLFKLRNEASKRELNTFIGWEPEAEEAF